MPVPLRLNNQGQSKETSFAMDYSILVDHLQGTPSSEKKVVTASDKDASLIMELWMHGERIDDNETFKWSTDSFMSKSDIARLSARGFISKKEDMIRLTNRGKVVVTTMVLSEPNHFEKKRQDKSYNEILASMSKKNNSGYRIPRYSSSSSNSLRLS